MYQRVFKRLFDGYFSLLFLFLLSPLLITISILILMINGWPIIFSQERPGRDNNIFKMYKFRSMTNKKDEIGNLLPDEKRLTKFGKFIRKTSIDELPSLFNILKGDMSFIGPRPLLVRYLPYYTQDEIKRHNVRPGLTGLSQVNGRNYLSWDNRLKLDNYYVNNLNFTHDIYILFKTISKVIKREDVAEGHSNIMEDFDIERLKKIKKGEM